VTQPEQAILELVAERKTGAQQSVLDLVRLEVCQ
jgi:hypothetical protein